MRRVVLCLAGLLVVAGASCSSSSSPPASDGADGGGADGGAGEGGSEGSSGSDLPSYRSGTRLRARLMTAEGGAALFLGWHDVGLDTDCTFNTAADGKLRCVPSGDS